MAPWITAVSRLRAEGSPGVISLCSLLQNCGYQHASFSPDSVGHRGSRRRYFAHVHMQVVFQQIHNESAVHRARSSSVERSPTCSFIRWSARVSSSTSYNSRDQLAARHLSPTCREHVLLPSICSSTTWKSVTADWVRPDTSSAPCTAACSLRTMFSELGHLIGAWVEGLRGSAARTNSAASAAAIAPRHHVDALLPRSARPACPRATLEGRACATSLHWFGLAARIVRDRPCHRPPRSSVRRAWCPASGGGSPRPCPRPTHSHQVTDVGPYQNRAPRR